MANKILNNIYNMSVNCGDYYNTDLIPKFTVITSGSNMCLAFEERVPQKLISDCIVEIAKESIGLIATPNSCRIAELKIREELLRLARARVLYYSDGEWHYCADMVTHSNNARKEAVDICEIMDTCDTFEGITDFE